MMELIVLAVLTAAPAGWLWHDRESARIRRMHRNVVQSPIWIH